MTNADRIRAMTDEELANWLYDLIGNAPEVYPWIGGVPDCNMNCNGTTKTCRECWLEWLRKEA